MKTFLTLVGLFYSMNASALIFSTINHGVNNALEEVTLIEVVDQFNSNQYSNFSTEEVWQILPVGQGSPEWYRSTEAVNDDFKLNCTKTWSDTYVDNPYRKCEFLIKKSLLKVVGNESVELNLKGKKAVNILKYFSLSSRDTAYLRQNVAKGTAVENFLLILNWHQQLVQLKVETRR